MRILLTGGGTAGHINPALAIADKLRGEMTDSEFLFVGAADKMETTLVPAAGYPFTPIDVRGFRRRITIKNIGWNIGAARRILTASGSAGAILREFRPDIAIGTGGYVCGPVLRKAARMGIPVVVHESNAYPGVTVKLLAKHAALILLGDGAARDHLPPGTPAVITGNPISSGFTAYSRQQARAELGLDDRPLALSYGGSLGADALNRVMLRVMEQSFRNGGFQHIHAAGKSGYPAMVSAFSEKGLPLHGGGLWLREYIDDMPRCMAASDVVICRCGAMTISQLTAAGKPSILIPSPYVAENHQYHNAMTLVKGGAGICIEEKDLTEISLWRALEKMMPPPVREEMAQRAASLAVRDAADRVYQAIMTLMEPSLPKG